MRFEQVDDKRCCRCFCHCCSVVDFLSCFIWLLVARIWKKFSCMNGANEDLAKKKKRTEKKKKKELRKSLKAFAIVCKLLALQMALFAFLLGKICTHMLASCFTDLINTMYFNRPNLNTYKYIYSHTSGVTGVYILSANKHADKSLAHNKKAHTQTHCERERRKAIAETAAMTFSIMLYHRVLSLPYFLSFILSFSSHRELLL